MTTYYDRLQAGEFSTVPDVEDMKLADLKAELAKRGLPTSGNKADLQERLEQADAQPAAEDSDDAE